jgi:hypothetical protein
VRLRKWNDGAAACKVALELARTLDRGDLLDDAKNCMLESLVPLAAYAEAEPLLEQVIVERTAQLGADHATIRGLPCLARVVAPS